MGDVQKSMENIAQYTGTDDEIMELNDKEKVDYAFYLLGYNVNSAQELNDGLKALKSAQDPMNLLSMVQNPKKFGMLITAIAIFLMILSFVVLIGFYVYYGARGIGLKQTLVLAGGPAMVGILMIIILLKLLYGSLSKEIMKAYVLLPTPEKKKKK